MWHNWNNALYLTGRIEWDKQLEQPAVGVIDGRDANCARLNDHLSRVARCFYRELETVILLNMTNVMMTLEQDQRYSSTQRNAPAALPPGKTRYPCKGGWAGPRVGLDGWGRSCPHRDSILGSSSPWQISIPTMLSWPAYQIWHPWQGHASFSAGIYIHACKVEIYYIAWEKTAVTIHVYVYKGADISASK
jgi:hypothetical protein